MWKLALAVSAASAISLSAHAQPLIQPTRDVAVQYHVTGNAMAPGGPGRVDNIKITYSGHGHRMRVDPDGQPAFMIVDRTAGRMLMVMTSQNMYMEMPYDSHRVMNFSPENAKFTQHGTATVAGVSCTEYDVQSPQHTGTVCLTADGVMLRAVSKDAQHQGSMEATEVKYGPQPDTVFQPPPGFQKMDIAHMQGRPPR